MIGRRSTMRRKLYESIDSYVSILIDTAQFYAADDDDFFSDEFVATDSPKLRNFKRECQKMFGREAIKEYGGGKLEIIITESNYKKFALLANQHNVEYEVDDIVEF